MSVWPFACRVTAVVSMMKNATILEAAMPTTVSQPMRSSSRGACCGFSSNGAALGSASSSSTS